MASPIYGTAFIDVKPDLNNFGTALRTGVLGGGGGLLGSVGKTAGGLLGVGLLGGVAAAIGGGALLANIGETFDEAFDQIRIGTGETGAALAGLQQDFKDVFQAVPTDASTAAQAITELNQRLGLSGDDLTGLTKQFLELSRITGTDLTSNIENVTRAFGDWGVSAIDEGGAFLDILFRASQATGVSVDRLSATLVQFGAPLRQLGFSFQESTALIGKFEKEGVNTELVLGSMRIALGKLARAGEPAQETFERIVEDIKNVGTVSEANALALELFGARAGPDMAAAIREGRFDIKELFETIANGEDTIANAAEDTNDWKESLNILKNRVLVALEPLARRVFEGIGNAVEAATPHIEAFVEWFSEKAVPAIEAFWDKVQPIFGGLGDLVSGALGFVGDLFDLFEEPVDTASLSAGEQAISGLNEQALLVPGAVTPAKTAVREFIDTVGEVSGEIFTTVATSVTEAAEDIALANTGIQSSLQETMTTSDEVGGQWIELFERIGDTFTTVWGEIGDEIVAIRGFGLQAEAQIVAESTKFMQGQMEILLGFITLDWSRVWNGMGLEVEAVWNVITRVVEAGINAVLVVLDNFIPDAREAFLRGLRELQTGITNMAKAVEKFFRELPGKIVSWFTGGETLLKESGKKVVQSLIDGALSKFQAVKDVFNRLSDLIPSWKGPASADARLLTSAGQLIVEGLIGGIEDMFPEVRSVLQRLSDEVAGTEFDPIDIPVIGADDGNVLQRVQQAAARVTFDEPSTAGGGISIGQFSVNNPIGEPTEESVQSALLEVAISPIVNRLVSAGSSS